jgi:hypothetical protein
MPCRIHVPERVPEHIREPVQILRIPRIRYNRIGADEAAQGGSLILTSPFGLGGWKSLPPESRMGDVSPTHITLQEAILC